MAAGIGSDRAVVPGERQAPGKLHKLPANDNWNEVRNSVPGKKLSNKEVPKVFVSTIPAELIVLEGSASYLKVEGAPTLLWVNNTEADLFRMGLNGDYYFLVAGRWFKAATLDGPWTFATPTLPPDFAQIPVEHPRSRVLASVPGTGRREKRYCRLDPANRARQPEGDEGSRGDLSGRAAVQAD